MKKYLSGRFYSIRFKVLTAFLLVLLPVYILGFSLFLWGYQRLTTQIENAQLAQVRLYADAIDSEFSRVRSLQYDCVNDEDLLYLVNAYPIMDAFEKSQYLLRVQQRLQIMRNSSICIDSVTVHLPAIEKTINNSEILSLDESWVEITDSIQNSYGGGIFYTDDNQIQMIIQYPVSPREGRLPRVVMEISLSNRKIREILQGFSDYPDNELILTSQSGGFFLSNQQDSDTVLSDDEGMENGDFTRREAINGMDVQQTSVYLKNSDLKLTSLVPNTQLFGFTRIYLYLFCAFTVVSAVVMIIFAFSIRYLVHNPVQTLVNAFRELKGDRFDVRIERPRNDEFQYLYESFNGTMEHLQRLIEEVYHQQLLTQQAELKHLQSQINPHFLYNGFYNIYRMAKREGNENVAQLSNLLSEYYQYITRNAEDNVLARREIHHAKIYLNIQTIRFGDRIRIYIGPSPDGFQNVMVPRLIIQPLLENAFEHGIKDMDDPQIHLTFEETSDAFVVQVEDNGTDLQDAEIQALTQRVNDVQPGMETTAIINIHRRLRLRFGGESGLQFSRAALGGLRVRMLIVKGEAGDV